ncbi:PA0069 family radical SAM protein [Ferruginivarius sediminum]|uniref:Radical SAM protein n=1 Tax=Ferruginivarius sediminum TaxID=2661937 RepID=A0A369T768_9PROT|nr:PA0069 family radical SAM protein [Ferruginivarius sediminum]RDD61118.1 radical SAM protein [Ferruginivarius sediminum]
MDEKLRDRAKKGRGAVANDASARFTALQRSYGDDGWGSADEAVESAPATAVGRDSGRTAISWNKSPDIPFDRSINPYKGCEHGCIYCFARPTHAYLDLSPGLDFETKIFAKENAAELLRKDLAKPSYKPDVITLGANTDPYQPVERRLEITRRVLEVLAEARHPVSIVTKSATVLRDLDILREMADRRLVRVNVSVTTLDRDLARKLEPRAPTPPRRLEAIRGLAAAGVPVGVLAAPMIPALNDSELEKILTAAVEAGADTGGYILLRLPHEIKNLFEGWLETHFPARKEHVLSLVRQSRGGRLYDADWGQRMKGKGHYARLIQQRFRLAARKLNLNADRYDLDCSQFVPPAPDPRQMALF